MIVFPFADAPTSPKQELVRWRAWEVQVPNYDAPSWHLVGFLSWDGCAKVSSALAQVNRAGTEARSKTGRIYLLAGGPGFDANAERLWLSWQRQHGVAVLRDVTAEVRAGRQPATVHLLRRAGEDPNEDKTAASLRGHRKW
jgi:hypothetical protein